MEELLMLTDSSRWLAAWARRHPDHPAIVYVDDDGREETVTYAELDARATAFAQFLAHQGVSRGDRVACLMTNRIEFMVTFFGVHRAGAAFVSINTFVTPREMSWMLGNTEPAAVVSERHFSEVIASVRPDVSVARWVGIDGPLFEGSLNASVLPDFSEEVELPNVGPEDMALINFTSGTTGVPKGVVLTHSNLEHLAYTMTFTWNLGHTDKGIVPFPLCFTGALVSITYPWLSQGLTVVLTKSFDAEMYVRLIERFEVTIAPGVPTAWNMIRTTFGDRVSALKSLRFVAIGGAPVSESMLGWLQDNGITAMQGYGLTEAGGFNIQPDGVEGINSRPSSVGKPTIGVEAMIAGPDLEPLGPGQQGEIVLRGPLIMKEYWRNPEATAATIERGWLHTGDIGYVDEDGYYYVVDRQKDVIISGGLNVYPAEVEGVLDRLDGIAEVCVIGLPDPKWGERVTAVVVRDPGASVTAEQLTAHCTVALGSYKRPRQIEFVDSIPKSTSGKYLRRKLREALASAASEQ
ncbi:class I adenylate-forming enzyme family protein [Rhodococcus sp. T2V]|uniref:class I adenylate-forming enzyme family protein n=1 Tax=Rhodococcus sp. T2V TaxID=3034164 RepID=UPI0023E12F93|nr:AMP-binding protein [Rhodococcus sp. T2V]